MSGLIRTLPEIGITKAGEHGGPVEVGLDDLGSDGWLLVAIVDGRYFFVKEIEQ